MWDGFNKRKFPRVNLHCEIVILPETEGALLVGRTENLGSGGVCVLLTQALERFSECKVHLELTENLPNIDCKGKVVWIVPTRATHQPKPFFDTGIEFMNLDVKVEDLIRDFIKKRTEVIF